MPHYKDCQLGIQVDNSSGHGAGAEGALNASAMAGNYGGKQGIPRSVILRSQDIGPEPALQPLVGGGTKDVKLAAGEKQHFVYGVTERDSNGVVTFQSAPPFYIDAPRNDTWVTDKHGKQKLKPGFEGKAKGTKQIVWESGWWREGMIHDMSNSVMQSKKNTKNYTKADLATYVLSQRPDFREEISDLEQLMIRRGHILIMCVSGFVQSHHSLHSISSFLSPARASVISQFVSSYADTNSCCTWCRSNVTLR